MELLGVFINVVHKKPYRNFFSLLLTASFMLHVCSTDPGDTTRLNIPPPCAAETVPNVTVEHSTLDKATIYSISSTDCSIKWIARDSEKGVIKHWSQCTAPLALQLPLLTKICTAFFSSDKNTQAFHTLFWGGLEPERKPASQEMSLRLALAAYKSPRWDAKKGKPKNGDINGFVKDLASRELIYPELKELFDRFQRTIMLSAVEKVRVLEGEKLPFYDQLKQQGVKADDRLPFDCMVWFLVSKK